MRGIHGKSADTIRDTIGRGTAQRNLNGNRRKIYQSHRRSFSCHPYTPFTKPTSVVQHRAPSELLREELPEDSTVQQATLVKQAAWISHVPQMISTALAAALVEEFGDKAPLLPAGGRALQEMTRISASPYSMWRDIAISNKVNLEKALWKVEQRLAHIRENLATRQLAEEFEQAHALKKIPVKKR